MGTTAVTWNDLGKTAVIFGISLKKQKHWCSLSVLLGRRHVFRFITDKDVPATNAYRPIGANELKKIDFELERVSLDEN